MRKIVSLTLGVPALIGVAFALSLWQDPLPPILVLPPAPEIAAPAEAPTVYPPRDDKYKDDPHAFCRKGPPMEGETSAHECHCTLMCVGDVKAEKPECELYCTKARCTCYPDDPCKLPPDLK